MAGRLPKNLDTSDEALERLRAVVRANPRATTFVVLANSLCEAGKAAEAEEVARGGLLQHPRLVTGQVALGRALFGLGRLVEAQEVLVEAVKANADHGDGFRWLGEVVSRRGDHARARTILEHAEQLLPGDETVAELLRAAGGQPTARMPRPKTDFEHTRIANARAIAERMFQEAEEPTRLSDPDAMVPREAVNTPMPEDATVVTDQDALSALINDGPATPQPRAAAVASPRSGPAARPSPPVAHATVARPSGAWPVPLGAPAQHPQAPDAGQRFSLAPPPALATPAQSSSSARTFVVIALLGLLAGASMVGYLKIRAAELAARKLPDVRAEILRELRTGSANSLMRARDLGVQMLAGPPIDADVAARVGFINALLMADFGIAAGSDARAAIALVGKAGAPPPARIALVEATNALLALAEGDFAEAGERAQAASEAAPGSVEALWVSARVRTLAGNLESAQRDLTAAIAKDPDRAAIVIDWAALLIATEDAPSAVNSLNAFLDRNKGHARALLMLAEAERAAGARHARPVDAACADEGKRAPLIGAACALDEAAEARLHGDRGVAIARAKDAVAGAGVDARLLAAAGLELALLGEIDAAVAAIARAKQHAGATFAGIAWAEAAVRLGQGESLPPDSPIVQRPISPETRLVAARAVLATGGATALAALLRRWGPLVEPDRDLHFVALLGRSGPLAKAERTELEAEARKGHPVAAYVVARMSASAGTQLMEKAMTGHGDACEAARLFVAQLRADGHSPTWNPAIRALKARNAGCTALPASIKPP